MTADDGLPARPRRELVEFALVSGGKIAALGSLILCNVLVARWVTDAGEYGRYSAAISLVLLLDAALGAPIDLSVIRFSEIHRGDPDRIARVHAAAFRFKLILGGILLAAASLYSDIATAWYFGDGRPRLLLLIAVVAVVVMLMVRSTAVRLQAQGEFLSYALLDGIQGILRLVAITAPMTLGWRSAEWFLAAHVAGSAVAFLTAFCLLPKGYLLAPWPSGADLREGTVQTALTAGIIVTGTLTGRSDVPIVAAARSAEDAGYYAAALQVATLLTLFASYYSVVMQPRIMQLSRDGTLMVSLRRNVVVALLMSALVLAAAVWILPTFLPTVFGSRYSAAVPIAQVLLIGTCFDLFSMPIMMVYSIQRFPKAMFSGEVIVAVVFFWLATATAESSLLAMAWFATGVRLAKMALYGGITLNAEMKKHSLG